MELPLGRAVKSLLVTFVFILACPIAPTAAADGERRAVEVVATGEPRATSAVEALVRELSKRLPVVIVWVEAPRIDLHDVVARRVTDPAVIARVWVDLSDPDAAHLFVADAASDHFLVRTVPAEEGHIEVEHEAVAQIIGFAVEAILDGAEIGVTRDVAVRQILAQPAPAGVPQAEPGSSSVRPPASLRDSLSVELGALVGLRAYGQGPAIGVGPGLLFAVGVSTSRVVRPLFILEVQYEAPANLQANEVAVRLESLGASLQGGLEARVGPRVFVRAAGGLGADALYAQPHAAAGSAFSARGPFWLAAAVATVRMGVEVVVARPVSLFVSAGCDVDLSGVTFPVSENEASEPNVVPWRAWPVASLGVSVSLDKSPRRP